SPRFLRVLIDRRIRLYQIADVVERGRCRDRVLGADVRAGDSISAGFRKLGREALARSASPWIRRDPDGGPACRAGVGRRAASSITILRYFLPNHPWRVRFSRRPIKSSYNRG